MNRRGFLSGLLGGAAALTLDHERVLWVPGKKLISIPKPSPRLLYRVPFIKYHGGRYGAFDTDGSLGYGSGRVISCRLLEKSEILPEDWEFATPILELRGDAWVTI